jgi:hypothetical protein
MYPYLNLFVTRYLSEHFSSKRFFLFPTFRVREHRCYPCKTTEILECYNVYKLSDIFESSLDGNSFLNCIVTDISRI